MPRKNNIERCPNCGGSDVKFNQKLGKLQCGYCRSVFESELGNERDDVTLLKGKIVGKGAEKIIDEKVMVTLKCNSCGAEVSINTAEALTAKCPWCRHLLSIKDKLPNGAVPDMILPFKLSRTTAYKIMNKFISEHRAFGKPEFIDEFREENLMGVYLPYMVVDMNVHAEMAGTGEHETRRYMVGSGDDAEMRYDADVYKVGRKFDLVVDDLTIEASSDKLNQNVMVNTNNIISAIMPFDTQNAVKWDARYTTGFACEKRDVDIDELDKQVKLQVEDIMRFRMRETITAYDRGVRWERMKLEQKGVKWKTAYMPVWLYSYLDNKKNGTSILHYVAVNARTGELVGSSPINNKKIAYWVALVPSICMVLSIIFGIIRRVFNIPKVDAGSIQVFLFVIAFFWFLISGIVILVQAANYRNKSARHVHERDTAAAIKNVVKEDFFQTEHKRLRWSQMFDRNDLLIRGIRVKEGNSVRNSTSSTIGTVIVIIVIAFLVITMFPIIFLPFFLL